MRFKNLKHFERELNLIQDENLRKMVSDFLECETPFYFWTDGASSSGKFHPKFARKEGGLVRHTKAVVMFAEELLCMSTYAYMREEYKDYVIAGCILHDTIKYGFNDTINKEAYKNHAENASFAFQDFCEKYFNTTPSPYLLDGMRAHMGQWSTNKEDRPFTNIDRCIHMADYMASRSFIDIPEISQEWENVEAEQFEIDEKLAEEELKDLPF